MCHPHGHFLLFVDNHYNYMYTNILCQKSPKQGRGSPKMVRKFFKKWLGIVFILYICSIHYTVRAPCMALKNN